MLNKFLDWFLRGENASMPFLIRCLVVFISFLLIYMILKNLLDLLFRKSESSSFHRKEYKKEDHEYNPNNYHKEKSKESNKEPEKPLVEKNNGRAGSVEVIGMNVPMSKEDTYKDLSELPERTRKPVVIINDEPVDMINSIIKSSHESVREYEYLQEPYDGIFSRTYSKSKGCFFRCWKENGLIYFEFFGDEEVALGNLNAIFDGVCELQGSRVDAIKIENVKPGLLSEDLRVQQKAVIQLIS